MVSNPLHFALVVAIWQYPWGYDELQAPRTDALEFTQWLEDPKGGGLPTGNVAVCQTLSFRLTRDTTLPTIFDIEAKLRSLVRSARQALDGIPAHEREERQKQSRLYVFAAGHGVMPGDGSGGLLDAWAPEEMHCFDLGTYGTALVELGLFGQVVLFGDCCRNDEPLVPSRKPNLPPNDGSKVRTVRLTSYATSAGCGAWEDTLSNDPDIPSRDRRGYYSRALMYALEKGAAVHPKSGYVTSTRLHEYLKATVGRRTAGHPPEQRQVVDSTRLGPVDLTFGPDSRPAFLHKVTINFPTDCPEVVQLVAPDGNRTRHRLTANRQWTPELYDGLWWIDPADRFTREPVFEVCGEDRIVDLA